MDCNVNIKCNASFHENEIPKNKSLIQDLILFLQLNYTCSIKKIKKSFLNQKSFKISK